MRKLLKLYKFENFQDLRNAADNGTDKISRNIPVGSIYRELKQKEQNVLNSRLEK